MGVSETSRQFLGKKQTFQEFLRACVPIQRCDRQLNTGIKVGLIHLKKLKWCYKYFIMKKHLMKEKQDLSEGTHMLTRFFLYR